MNNEQGKEWYGIGIDDSGLDKTVKKVEEKFNAISEAAEKSGKKMDAAYTKSVAGVGEASSQARAQIIETIELQKRAIAELEKQIGPLEEEFRRLNMGTSDPKMLEARQKASAAFREVKKELKDERGALVELEKKLDTQVQKRAQLRTELMNTRDEMAQLKLAGKEEGKEYKELEVKLERLGTAYNEVQRQQRALTTGGTQMAGVLSGFSALTGALSAYAGVAALVGGKSEDLIKIQTRIQSLIAVTIGLQQISNALHSTSAFRITTLRKVKELWAVANIKVAATLGITNIQAQILMATLTLGLSVAITAIVAGLSVLISKGREAAKEQREFHKSIAEGAAKSITDYLRLQKTYKGLGDDMDSKKKFIDANKKAFEELGVSVNGVNDADNLFITNTEAFKKAVLERARSAAYMELAIERMKEGITKEMEAANMPDTKTRYITDPETGRRIDSYIVNNKGKDSAITEAQTQIKKAEDLITKSVDSSNKATEVLTQAGLSGTKTVLEGTKAYWEAQRQSALATLEGLKDVDRGSKIWDEAVKKYNNATAKLKMWDLPPAKDDGSAQQLMDRITASQLALEKSRLDAMKQGRDKEIEEIRYATKQKISEIDKQEQQLKEAYKKAGKAYNSGDAANFGEQRVNATAAGLAREEELNIKLFNAIKEKQEELSEIFLSNERKKEQAIKDRYDAERKWANEMFGSGGMTQEQYNSFINLIDSAETEEIFADFRDKYKTAVEEIAEIERQALADKAKANTDAQRDLVEQWRKIQIENVQKSILDKNGLGKLLSGDMSDFILQEIKKGLPLFHSIAEASSSQLLKAKEAIKGIKLPDKLLNELKEAGFDTAKLVELLEKAKDASTESVDVELFEEIGKIVERLAASLGALGNSLEGLGGTAGEIGGAMSGLASSAGDVMAVFKKGASDTDIISAGINGLMNLASMVVNQIKANREEQERWTAAIAESVHQASLLRIEALNYKDSNIFGIENPYARAIAGARQYTQSMSELNAAALKLNDGQIQTGTKKAVSGKNVMSGVGSGAALGAAIGGVAGAGVFSLPAAAIGAAIGAVVGGIVGLFSTKTVKVFESLKKKYGEIYNKDTFELNPKILADYSKLDEATKKLVDNWKEIKEKAKEAQEQMRQNFKDIAGDIGTKLSDSLENAFRDGKIFNAIDDFKGYMTKTIEEIISQLIFSAHFEAMFKELQQKFEDSFGESGDGTIIDDLIWFTQKYKEGLEDYNRDMQIAKDQLVNEGFDIFGSLERQGAKKGIANASQDSIDDLMGTAVNIQSHTYSIMNDFKNLLADTNAIVKHTMSIDNNTKRLENIEQHMSDVKKGIDTINLKGVQLK